MMARKPVKRVKASKIAQQLADMKHMGDEPDVQGIGKSNMDVHKVLNWYNYMYSRTDARGFIETYLKSKGRTAELKTLKSVPDAWINLQAGWYARIMSRGGLGWETWFEDRLKETLSKAGARSEEEQEEQPKLVEKPKISIQDRMSDKASDLTGELEELIDKEGYTVDVYDWLTKKQVAPAFAKKIRDFFKPVFDEAGELNHARWVSSKTACPQLLEGYKRLSKNEVRARYTFYAKLISDCERFADVAKKQKTPPKKKKKPMSVEKKLKGLKFQPESKEYKLASIKPEKIIGALEFFSFNTKYKTLHVFKAIDRGGLDIKGTTILNYDEKTSKGYRIGRKTEESLAAALKGGKRAINDLLSNLTECTLQHRCNENTILLRSEK